MTVPPDPHTQAALDRVRADLAALPDLTMPPDVAERIGRALAGAGAAPGDGSTGVVDAEPPARPRAERPGGVPAEDDRVPGGREPDRTGRGAGDPAGSDRAGDHAIGHGRDGNDGAVPVRRGIGRGAPRRRTSAPPRHPAGRRRAVRAVLGLAVPAGVAAGVLALLLVPDPRGPEPVSRADELRAAGAAAFGPDGAGPLADPVRRRGCLTAAGVPEPGATLLGGVRHDVDGRPGTLLVLGTGVLGRYRLVVVDAGCGPSGGRVLAQTVAGR